MTKIFIENHTYFITQWGMKLEKMKKMHFFLKKMSKSFGGSEKCSIFAPQFRKGGIV